MVEMRGLEPLTPYMRIYVPAFLELALERQKISAKPCPTEDCGDFDSSPAFASCRQFALRKWSDK